MNITAQANTLYYGDCLDIMQVFPDNYVDLICLDPPFNSDRKYNNIFKNSKESGLTIDPEIKAFDDIWEWNEKAAERVERVKSAIANPASKVIEGFETFIPNSKMLSYTSYMAERLFEMHRILKGTGSIYLHCDPYASHYLKLVMDAIFSGGGGALETRLYGATPDPAIQKDGFHVSMIEYYFMSSQTTLFLMET